MVSRCKSIEIIRNKSNYEFENQVINDNIEVTISELFDKIINKIIPNYEFEHTELKTKSMQQVINIENMNSKEKYARPDFLYTTAGIDQSKDKNKSIVSDSPSKKLNAWLDDYFNNISES